MEKNLTVDIVKGVSKKGNAYLSVIVSCVVNGVKIEIARGFVNDQSKGILALAGIKVE